MSDQNIELFTEPRIRDWLPDETLYSLSSRQHIMSGNLTPSQTCTQLYGHPRTGSAHDFPCNIDAFCSRTNLEIGSAMTIIRQHTMLPFYLPFCKPDVAKNAIESIRSGGIRAVKASMGLLASRFGCNHPLKVCINCLKNDTNTHGVAYWHLAHQLPGVWICPAHETILRISDIKTTGVGRFGWYLPSSAGHQLPWDAQELSEDVPENILATLKALAQCSIATARLPEDVHLSQGDLIAIYRLRSTQINVMSPNGRMHHERLASLMLPLYRNIKFIHEFSALPMDHRQVCNQLNRMLSEERMSSHPLRHFLLIISLFGSWSEFWKAYVNRRSQLCTISSTISKTKHSHTKVMDEKKQQFLKLILDVKMTISGASRMCGIDTQTGIVWASKAGVYVKRRPKLLTPDIRLKLISALHQGKDKKFIADKLSISVQSVTNVLRSEAGLADLWHQIRYTKNQYQYRKNLSDFIKKCSNSTLNDFREFSSASFAWLYRNDRCWLNESAAGLAKRIKTNNSNVKWDARDAALSKLVQNTGLAIKSTSPAKRITIGQLCQGIPSLKPRLSQLNSLPLTRKAITVVIAYSTSNSSDELFFSKIENKINS